MSRSLDKAWVWLSACTVLLLVVPLFNGFPLTYPDTGTYLRSAFQGYVPFDRPYWYGVFIRITSGGGLSLWGTMLAQALLTAWLLRRAFKALQVGGAAALGIVAVLVATTGLSWYTGQLMPDIFTALGVLALLLLLLDPAPRTVLAAYAAVVVLAALVHASHVLTFSLIAVALLFLRRIPWVRRRSAILLVAACWPLLVLLNLAVTGSAQLGRGSEVFLTARLIDADILAEWLDARCPDSREALCPHRHQLPQDANAFLWAPESPLYALGGWEEAPAQLRPTVLRILTEPELLMRFASNSLQGTARQLVEWELGAGFIGRTLQDPSDPVHYMVRHTMEKEHPAFLRARQVTGDGNERWVRTMDRVFRPVMALSHVVLLALLVVPRWSRPRWRQAALLLVLALVANALVCASLSMVADRFSSRMNWLVPMLVLSALWYMWQQRRGRNASRTRSSQPQPGL